MANWPEKRQLAWNILTRARAIENQCYVVAVNRAGSDPVCQYAGGSVVADPIGQALATSDGQAQALSVVLDIERLQEMRRRFRVLDDRDA